MPNKQLEVGCSQSSISPAMSLSLSTNISTSANKSSRLIDLNHIKSSSSSSSSSSTSSSNSLDRNEKSVARFQTTNNYSSSQELKSSSTPPCPIPTSSVRPVTCDGQQQLLQVQQHQQQVQICRQIDSGGSSPFADPSINNDFINTEFYIDESLPSSLSEHPNDDGHAIVSLLQVLDEFTAHNHFISSRSRKRSTTSIYFYFYRIIFFYFNASSSSHHSFVDNFSFYYFITSLLLLLLLLSKLHG